MPPLPTRDRPASNCGFTSSTRSASTVVQRTSAGATVRREMNERSATARSTAPPRCSGSRLRALVRSSTVTRASVRSAHASWPAPDVDREHRGRAGLQEAVGEPTGRGAEVEGTHTGDRHREAIERGGELLSAARHEAGRVTLQLDGLRGVDEARGRVGATPGDEHPPSADGFHRLTSACEQSPAHELGVESPALGHPARIRGPVTRTLR